MEPLSKISNFFTTYTGMQVIFFLFSQLPTIGKPKLPQKRLYDTSLLQRAYKDVPDNGISVYHAARLYGVPESTLRDCTISVQPVLEDGKLPSCGDQPVFFAEEEKQLVNHLAYMSFIGYGYTRQEFLNLATEFA